MFFFCRISNLAPEQAAKTSVPKEEKDDRCNMVTGGVALLDRTQKKLARIVVDT